MDKRTQQRFAFYGRSLLWSLLLYAVLMMVINWDDVQNTMHGKSTTTIVNVSPAGTDERRIAAPNPAAAGVVNRVAAMLRAIAGFAR